MTELLLGIGDPDCLACDKVWRHHHRPEAGTRCVAHDYGEACADGLKEPGGDWRVVQSEPTVTKEEVVHLLDEVVASMEGRPSMEEPVEEVDYLTREDMAPDDMPAPTTSMAADALAERTQVVRTTVRDKKSEPIVGKFVMVKVGKKELRGLVRAQGTVTEPSTAANGKPQKVDRFVRTDANHLVIALDSTEAASPNKVIVIDRLRDAWRVLFP